MGDRVATVVIEARSLMREALVSLMESHSYEVIRSIGSPADIDCSVLEEEQPKLVILGALPTDRVTDTTSSIRKCWQNAKIIVLFENASSADLHRLLVSDVDACIPMDASPRTLIDTLRLIDGEPIRVLVMGGSEIPRGLAKETMQKGQALAANLASSLRAPSSVGMPFAVGVPANDAVDGAAADYRAYALSGREEQILKALVRGYSNKMIARMHSVTEATVKVHMKAILRKIRVANRTQAAIWALRNPYFSGDLKEEGAEIDVQEVRLVNGRA